MKQNKRNENKIEYGCQTLREFLVIKAYKLISYNIPFEELSKWPQKMSNANTHNIQSTCKANKNELDEVIIKEINQRIEFIEQQIQFRKVYESTPMGTSFLLGVYILYNLQHFLLDNTMKMEKISDIAREHNLESDSISDLSDEVEHF